MSPFAVNFAVKKKGSHPVTVGNSFLCKTNSLHGTFHVLTSCHLFHFLLDVNLVIFQEPQFKENYKVDDFKLINNANSLNVELNCYQDIEIK